MSEPQPRDGGTGVPPVGWGGTGVPPVVVERVTRRHLPHWQRAHATYFLTWRCRHSVSLADAERDLALAAILFWQGKRWDVLAAVVMPDHVHVLAQPLQKCDGFWDIGELLHSVKSFSAHQINRLRTAAGSIWLDERYDRWMRDEDEIAEKHDYIVNNPVRAGLVQFAHEYRWLLSTADDRRDAGPA